MLPLVPPDPPPLARRLLPARIAVMEMDPRSVTGTFLPGEEALVERAVEKRRAQYLAGRLCARRALAHIGVVQFPLLDGPDRAPIWPAGICGSITHTDAWCAVAVGRVDHVATIGLDVESDEPLPERLWERVLREEERAALGGLGAEERGSRGKLIFSAKECAYKAQYPLSRRYLGFHAMRVEVDEAAGSFRAVFVEPAAPFVPGDVLHGRFLRDRGLVMTAVTLPEPPR